MPRRSRHLAAVEPADDRTALGTFADGNKPKHAELVPGLNVDSIEDPRLRTLAQHHRRRLRGALGSGLFKSSGSRLHGLLRSAVLADFEHDDLAGQALTAPTAQERRALLADARAAGRQAAAHWRHLFALVGGPVYRRDATGDPLAALAAELGGTDDD